MENLDKLHYIELTNRNKNYKPTWLTVGFYKIEGMEDTYTTKIYSKKYNQYGHAHLKKDQLINLLGYMGYKAGETEVF